MEFMNYQKWLFERLRERKFREILDHEQTRNKIRILTIRTDLFYCQINEFLDPKYPLIISVCYTCKILKPISMITK